MINDTGIVIKSDWWAVALDETEHWNIPEKYRDKILQIGTDFFYNRNLITHCCSLQGSYFLHSLGPIIILSDRMYDPENSDLHEEIHGWIGDRWAESSEGGDYYALHDIDEIPDEHQERYGEVAADLLDENTTEADVVREHWQGNCPQSRMPAIESIVALQKEFTEKLTTAMNGYLGRIIDAQLCTEVPDILLNVRNEFLAEHPEYSSLKQ